MIVCPLLSRALLRRIRGPVSSSGFIRHGNLLPRCLWDLHPTYRRPLTRDRWVAQQRVRFWASPASLVSLYFGFMSLAVSASVLIVVSRSTRCRLAISLVAIMAATQAFTAPKAQRSMQGT